MKRFKLFVPSFIAIIFCMLLIAGSTFALFTSEAKADISVTSGKVEISATLDNLELYSADHEYTTGEEAGEIFANDELWANYAGKYYFKPQTGENPTFANGGTAAVTGSNLAIEKMTPGDKVELDLTVANTSNVNIKYRVVIEASYKVGTRTYDQALAYALKTTIGNTTKTSLSAYKSNWILLTAGTSQNPAPLHLEFELPLLAGNEYQDSGVLFSFKVEAVQANAATSGVESFEVISGYSKTKRDTVNQNKVIAKDIIVDKAAAAAATPENPDAGKLTVEAEVQAEQISDVTFKDATGADMTNVTSTQLEVSDLFLTKDEFTNETTISADVQLKDQDGNNIKSSTELVKVEVFVGKGFNDVKVIHDGQAPMTQKTSAENLAENESYYNSESGIVTFMTKSFSPYTFIGDFAALNETTKLYYADLQDAINAASDNQTVSVLKDLVLDPTKDCITINKSLTLNGNNHTITGHGKRGSQPTSLAIGTQGEATVFYSVTIRDLRIVNENVSGRGIETRGHLESLVLDHCYVNCTGANYPQTPQALTIGGNQSQKATISITNNSHIECNSYYSIIMFNPVELSINNSEIVGWASLYFKGASSSEGSHGSTVTASSSKFISINVNSGPTDDFGAVVFEDNNIACSFENCVFDASQIGEARQYAFLASYYAARRNNVTVELSGAQTVIKGELIYIYSNWEDDGLVVTATAGTYDLEEWETEPAGNNISDLVIPNGYEATISTDHKTFTVQTIQ